MPESLHGSCLCGKLTFDLINVSPEDAKKTSLCHCRACRKITGSSYSVNLTIPEPSFKLKSGDLKKARITHVDAGFEFSSGFCGDCGSPIFGQPHTPPGVPELGILVMQVGSLDDTDPLATLPAEEINTNDRLGWVPKIGSATQKRTYQE